MLFKSNHGNRNFKLLVIPLRNVTQQSTEEDFVLDDICDDVWCPESMHKVIYQNDRNGYWIYLSCHI